MTGAAGDRQARRGFSMALGAVIAVPALVLLLTALPDEWRKPVFLFGIAAVAAVALWGGALARAALAQGTGHRVPAVAGMLLGLILGVTATMFLFWTVVALVL